MQALLRISLLSLVLVTPAISLAGAKLPVSLIRIPESVTTVFVAETSTSEFHRFERVDNALVHSGSFYMSIGVAGPGKQRSGDKRTPLGAYFVTEQLDTSKLHEKYGITAFPLDYPNAWDQREGRDGDGIWLHGVDPLGGRRPERDTEGCIALSNADLGNLASGIEDNVTPVLVTTEAEWREPSENDALGGELESRVAKWVASKANGDLFGYLSIYDDGFRRWGMDKREWSSLGLQTTSQRTIRKISYSDLLLLRYPTEEGLFLSRFQLTVNDGEREVVSRARLYWRRDASGVLKVIAEDSG